MDIETILLIILVSERVLYHIIGKIKKSRCSRCCNVEFNDSTIPEISNEKTNFRNYLYLVASDSSKC